MIRKIFLFLACVCFQNLIWAQPPCYIEHYGLEDGLSQQTIMAMLQDKKGFMWFSTWNGLCKFDAYKFTSYKPQSGDQYHLKSNRIDRIYEDKYGYIWTYSYDKEAHRFDPETEKFTGVTSIKGYENLSFFASRIVPMPSGKVWLLSDSNGCICVLDSLFNMQVMNVENEQLKGNTVFSILEDKQNYSWILTNNGLTRLSAGQSDPVHFFSEKNEQNRQSFYSCFEQENEIWFGSDKGRIWIYEVKNEQFRLLQMKSSSEIIEIKKLSDHKILLLTDDDGFYIHNQKTGQSIAYNKSNLSGMCSNKVRSSYIDRFQNIWFELDCPGVAKFNPANGTLKHFEVKVEDISTNVFVPDFIIFEDIRNRLWVHPRGGGFSLYDEEKDILLPFFNEPFSSGWKFSNVLHSAYSDRQGNLWLSTRSHGLEKIVFDNNYFRTILVNPNVHSTISNDIRSLFEDSMRHLWVGTKDGQLKIFDQEKKLIGHLCIDGSVGSGNPISGITYDIIEDKEKNIWIATKGEGIYIARRRENEKKLSYEIIQYKNDPSDIYSLSDNGVYSVFQDQFGRIWIGTYGGGLNLVETMPDGKLRFINHRNHLKNYPIDTGYQIRVINMDQHGNICVGTTFGLIMFSPDFESPEKINYRFFSKKTGENKGLASNDVFDIFTSKQGETFIATFGGGISRIVETDDMGFPLAFKSYNLMDGLPSDATLSITEDKKGKLWICTEGNLTRFDPEKESFETFGEVKRMMTGKSFSEASVCRMHDGEILFGFSKGILSFFPEEMTTDTFEPYIALVDFRLFNKEVKIGEDSPLLLNIDDISELVLNHKQNFFSIEYATLDFTQPENMMYAYKLEGFDEDWIYMGNQRVANYTNLPKGEYIFRIKSTNGDGLWMDKERQLHVKVLPSFWETPLAYALYVILFFGLVFVCVRILIFIYRLKDKVRLEHSQSEMKLRFFTDISHEIRTPLTMIVSPVDNMLHDENTPTEIKQQLGMVSQSTNRMLRMVNQILDFRKIQHQQLKVQEIELGTFVSEVCKDFVKTAENQHIDFRFNDSSDHAKVWIDCDFTEKIFFNLLSNAFKYTPEGKSIEVTVKKQENAVSVQIKDEGYGISKEKQKVLFTRFASFNEDKNKPSTGIGLSIVKDLAEKHKAKVAVESELGKGSSFMVIFQTGFKHFENNPDISISSDVEDLSPVELHEPENEDQRSSVLVVEDDDELRRFIVTILQSDYQVYEAVDGKDGFEKASELLPDFIVSDLMMPVVDGVEFLQKIKNDLNTSHIPFVLLTAKTNIQSKIEGLSYGADDYITKPFSVPYFRARIENLLKQRKRLQDFYRSSALQPLESVAPERPASPDEILMERIIQEINANIDNGDFSVEDLVSSVGMSRTVFFKKIKSLTGLAPVEFIRDVKLRKAAEIILSEDFSIKEVAYMVGMSDAKYFSKCFKKKFGQSPVQYKSQMKGL